MLYLVGVYGFVSMVFNLKFNRYGVFWRDVAFNVLCDVCCFSEDCAPVPVMDVAWSCLNRVVRILHFLIYGFPPKYWILSWTLFFGRDRV